MIAGSPVSDMERYVLYAEQAGQVQTTEYCRADKTLKFVIIESIHKKSKLTSHYGKLIQYQEQDDNAFQRIKSQLQAPNIYIVDLIIESHLSHIDLIPLISIAPKTTSQPWQPTSHLTYCLLQNLHHMMGQFVAEEGDDCLSVLKD